MKLFILRHEDRTQDATFFSPLTKKGLDNSVDLIKHLKDEDIHIIYSSPFIRTLQTIYPYSREKNLRINIDYGLSEIQHDQIIPKKSYQVRLPTYLAESFNYNKSNTFNNNFVFRIKNALTINQVSIMLILRLVPVVPFFLANILPALVGVRLFNFIWTTIIGIIPGGIVFTWIGVGVSEVFDRNEHPSFELLFSPVILGPILGLVALLLLPIILRRSGIMPRTITEWGNEKN